MRWRLTFDHGVELLVRQHLESVSLDVTSGNEFGEAMQKLVRFRPGQDEDTVIAPEGPVLRLHSDAILLCGLGESAGSFGGLTHSLSALVGELEETEIAWHSDAFDFVIAVYWAVFMGPNLQSGCASLEAVFGL